MHIKIRNEDCTEVWDGTLYKKLSDYPYVTDWEIRCLLDFCAYEAANGRACTWECDDPAVLLEIFAKMEHPEQYRDVPPPKKITECTACPYRRGCETAFVCHTADVTAAESILKCGKLLSAVRARGCSVEELMRESRNAAGDPADYFDYIMLAWGNCQAGDRLVTERTLGRFPTEDELQHALIPGVRFFFRYEDLASHPNAVFDGVLPMKIRDELTLSDTVFRIVIPSIYRGRLAAVVPDDLAERVLYADFNGEGLWDWAEKVYRIIEEESV